ncbi:hypothetical protein PROFUN_15473 [Planoprotostelium fungivorum]|uniref:Uncharacterized protein n=1 Tax=Planoprotostelium fungivorum TaxID=1890364 RepID=A0A2P6MUM8_9EUKA|nr:hypothetical protein PROFUN_15473 [Planoprotostelium fungivorum]
MDGGQLDSKPETNVRKDEDEPTLGTALLPREMLEGSSSKGQWNMAGPRSGTSTNAYLCVVSGNGIQNKTWNRTSTNVYLCVVSGKKDLETRDERFEFCRTRKCRTRQFGEMRRYIGAIVTLHDCIQWLLQVITSLRLLKSLVAECPHDNLMAEAEEEGFSNYRVVNRHFQLNTQASTSPSPNDRFSPIVAEPLVCKLQAKSAHSDYTEYLRLCREVGRFWRETVNMPPKTYETPAELAQAAREYGGDTRREQMSYITQTGSAGQQACLREEGLCTSNINKAFLDAAKDILKNN